MAAIRDAAVQEGGNIKCVLGIEVIGVEEQRVNDSRSPSWSLSPPPPCHRPSRRSRSLFPGVISNALATLALIKAGYKECRDNLAY